MEKFRNKPQSGSLFKSKFKTNDGSEEDSTREDFYGTFVDKDDVEWKLKGYINENQYGKFLKITIKDPEEGWEEKVKKANGEDNQMKEELNNAFSDGFEQESPQNSPTDNFFG